MNKILLFGSSQKTHVKKVLEMCGIVCIDLGETIYGKGWFQRKLLAIRCIAKCDYIYAVGGGESESIYMKIARLLHKRTIVHWIGTDVLNAIGMHKQGISISHFDYSFAGSPHLVKELSEIGIEAKEIPIVPTDISYKILPMPSSHAVLSYIPEGKEDFYGLTKLRELASANSEIPFYIVGNSGTVPMPHNVVFCGKLNRDEMMMLYKKTTVLIRLPEHDGLSLMLLEALGMGRQVMYTYQFPNTITPIRDNMEDLKKKFEEMITKPPKLNAKGNEYVNMVYSTENISKLYKAQLLGERY